MSTKNIYLYKVNTLFNTCLGVYILSVVAILVSFILVEQTVFAVSVIVAVLSVILAVRVNSLRKTLEKLHNEETKTIAELVHKLNKEREKSQFLERLAAMMQADINMREREERKRIQRELEWPIEQNLPGLLN